MQFDWKHVAPRCDFDILVSALGEPVCLHAAQFGSYAHMLRNFWTNIAPARQLQALLTSVVREPDRHVDDILLPGVIRKVAVLDDGPPRYRCNKKGERLHALPTLVATQASYAFREQGMGLV